MLPVLVVAAAGSGATAAVVTTRRRRWLNSKPQRRFKLRLADNSDAPFAHLQACSSNSTADASTAAAGCSDPPDFAGADKDTLSCEKQPMQQQQQQQHQHQQQQQHQEEVAHPYAEQIAAVLQDPHCPNFITTVTPSAPDKDSNSSSAARYHHHNHLHHHHDHRHHHHQQQQQEQQASNGEALSLPQPPPPLSSTPCLWVGTPRKLQQMLRELHGAKCIALDTEHNSQRSYLGMLCLLQLSTGDRDYLVDALALHDQLPLLRPLMADPTVLKVLHGGANDIGWLQRDAHVYLVNVFDTEKAAQALGREERSLAHLLRRYCGVVQDKSHQTADWRLRPLAAQLRQYARSDVHWLLHLAGLMVGEMQARSPSNTGDPHAPGPMLLSALQKSNSLTLKLYHKTPAALAVSNATAAAMRRYVHAQQQKQQGAMQSVASGRGGFVVAAAAGDATTVGAGAAAVSDSGLGELQLMLVRKRLAALVAWRDAAARADDEGPQYILPDAAMLELVSHPPTTAKQLLALVQQHTATLNAAVQHLPAAPHWSVSPAVKKGASQLVQLLQARSFECWGKESNPGLKNGSLQEGSGIEAAGEGAEAAAAGTAGSNSSSSRSTGLPLMVNGQLVQRAGAAVPQKEGRKKSKRDGDFRERLIKKFSAKTQVYDNCRMLSTMGDLLCYCDARKLQWYLDKGLATIEKEDPPTIRLLFEHKNADQQMGLDGFYSTSRANRCVVCGCEEHYLRYRVVPACYRRCFPTHLKSHRSHDIVLLCLDCHQAAHKAAEKVKRDVAAHYNIPLQPTYQQLQHGAPHTTLATKPQQEQGQQSPSGSDSDAADGNNAAAAAVTDGDDRAAEASAEFLSTYHRGDPQPVSGMGLVNQARAAAVALVRFGEAIPQARKRQLEMLVAQYMGKDVSAVDSASSSEPLVTPQEIETALLAGLGERKRAKTLKKLRRNLRQMHETGGEAASGEDEPDAAAAAAGDMEGAANAAVEGAAADQQGTAVGSAAAEDASDSLAVQNGNSSNSSGQPALDSKQLDHMLAQNRRLQGREEQQGHLWHGQQVVAAAMARGGEDELHRLVQRFRQIFVVACKPKFLPPNWAVDAVDTRQFGEYSVYAKEEAAAMAPDTGKELSEAAAAVAMQDWEGREESSAVGAEGSNSATAVGDGAGDGLSIFGPKH